VIVLYMVYVSVWCEVVATYICGLPCDRGDILATSTGLSPSNRSCRQCAFRWPLPFLFANRIEILFVLHAIELGCPLAASPRDGFPLVPLPPSFSRCLISSNFSQGHRHRLGELEGHIPCGCVDEGRRRGSDVGRVVGGVVGSWVLEGK